MKYRLVIFLLVATQCQGQFKSIQGNIYSMDDPALTTFNCSLEVTAKYGGDLICNAFQTKNSASVQGGGRGNGASFWVANTSYRVYGKTIALRGYSDLPVGYVIDQPVKALRVGTISYAFAARTGGMIDEPTSASTTIDLYDVGVNYFLPPKPLTPEEQKAKAEQAARTKAKAWESIKVQATNGNAEAQCRLGQSYLTGQHGETNRMAAIDWLGKASMQGNKEAQEALQKLSSPGSTNAP